MSKPCVWKRRPCIGSPGQFVYEVGCMPNLCGSPNLPFLAEMVLHSKARFCSYCGHVIAVDAVPPSGPKPAPGEGQS